MKKMTRILSVRQKIIISALALLIVGTVVIALVTSSQRSPYQAATTPNQISNTVTAAFTQPDGTTGSAVSNAASFLLQAPVDSASAVQALEITSMDGKRLSSQRFSVAATTNQKARVTFRFAYKSKTVDFPSSLTAEDLDRSLNLSSSNGLKHEFSHGGNANTYILGQFTARMDDGSTANSGFYLLRADQGATLEQFATSNEEAVAPATAEPAATATPAATPTPATTTDGALTITETTGSRSAHQSQALSLRAVLSEKAQQVRAEYAYAPSTTALPATPPTLDRSVSLSLESGSSTIYTAAWSGNADQHVVFRIIAKDDSGTEITSDYYVIDAAKGSSAKKY